MNISLNRQEASYKIETIDSYKGKDISNNIKDQVNKLLIKDLQIGDVLKVEIIDSLQKQISLMLEDGRVFEATLDNAINLHIGQELTFQVKDIVANQVEMEILTDEEVSEEDSTVANILKDLDIPITEDSQKAVKILMENMLPINKDNIKQIQLGLKTSELSTDTLLFMMKNDINITPSNLTKVEAYENGDIKLQNQLGQVLENIIESDNPEFLHKVHTVLTSAKELENSIASNSKEQNPANIIDGLDNGLYVEANQETPIKSQLLEQIFDKDGNLKRPPLSFLHGSENDILSVKEEIVEIFNELVYINPKNIKNGLDSKLENMKEFYKNIYEITDALDKVDDRLPKDKKAILYSDIKSNIEFLNISSKYDTIIHIPLIMQNQQKHGELYIFNKTNNKKKTYNEASMLISLETVFLGTVDTYIRKYNRQISIQFKTDSKESQNAIKSGISMLKNGLKNKGYDLMSVNYISSNENFKLEDVKKQDIKLERYRFDTKV